MSALLSLFHLSELKMTTASHSACLYSPGLCVDTVVWQVVFLFGSGLEIKPLIKVFDVIKILLH